LALADTNMNLGAKAAALRGNIGSNLYSNLIRSGPYRAGTRVLHPNAYGHEGVA
jgi:hypothetical protein